MSRGFLIVLAVLALAFAVITGLAVRKGVLGPPQRESAAIGGPFHLVTQAGRPTDQTLLNGKWSAVFFGYTNCPDACPTTLFALGEAEKLLGPRSADFQTVFVSVDPTRDTASRLASYMSNTAFPRQVAQAAKAYKVFYQKAGEGPDYTVNHSTFTYLMNPRGRFACVIPFNASPQEIAGHVERAMALGDRAQSC
jgi:protein SCO1